MSNEALKACPFCGGMDISAGEVLTTWGAGGTKTQFMCSGCGALGPEANLPEGEADYGDPRATEAWNRRAGLAELERQNAELRAALEEAADALQEFRKRWQQVPYFADRVNKATRGAIHTAFNPIIVLDAVGGPLDLSRHPTPNGAGNQEGGA
jgi:Lar family restriction alleviation protein